MMSKPQETAEKPPAAEKAKGPSDTVADLERRLQMLGGDNDPPPPFMSVAEAQQPGAFAAPPVAAAPPAATATGKSALLARIMAAQERAKAAKPKEDLPPPDFFSASLPPPAAAVEDTPPPAFDDAGLFAPPAAPPQEDAPPAFSLLEDTFDMKPPPAEPMAPPSYASAPPAPSAPSFEDLLGGGAPSAPPMWDGMEQLPPPPPVEQTNPQQSIEEEFAAALEGLSEEEKAALLAEQRQIMEQIEQNKGNTKTAALTAADAFDQRSNAAVAKIAGGESAVGSRSAAAAPRTVKLGDSDVALHGQEKTRAAIADGTAILVQCTSCSNWMQVTDNATLMFCPVCQVVSPVDRENAVMTKEEALQMEADRKLAEELQKEEYTAAERQERRQRRAQQQQQQQQAQGKKDESWWDWLGLGGGTTAPPQPQAQSAPQYRGDMGVSRPPGAGLSPAQTDMSFAGSYSRDSEDRALLNNRRGPGGARVAEAKPLFACVADAVGTAASSFSTAIQTQSLTQDDEGNVHGVDGSSLLVMSNAGRNQN